MQNFHFETTEIGFEKNADEKLLRHGAIPIWRDLSSHNNAIIQHKVMRHRIRRRGRKWAWVIYLQRPPPKLATTPQPNVNEGILLMYGRWRLYVIYCSKVMCGEAHTKFQKMGCGKSLQLI